MRALKGTGAIVAVTVATAAFGVAGACTFPDVGIDPGKGGGDGTSAATLAGTTMSTGGSTSSATASTSEVGGGSSTDGGGGSSASSTSEGGSGGEGGAGGDGASSGTLGGQGGAGACPAGCDCGTCPADAAEGDCDGDGDPDPSDCHRCNPFVYDGQDTYFGDPYEDIDGGPDSYDYDCDDAMEMDHPYVADQCTTFSLLDCPSVVYHSIAPVCGGNASKQNCNSGLSCTVGSTEGVQIKCR